MDPKERVEKGFYLVTVPRVHDPCEGPPLRYSSPGTPTRIPWRSIGQGQKEKTGAHPV